MRSKVLAWTAALFAVPCGIALGSSAASINQLVVFGDSLSDPGNASFLTGGSVPGTNYATRQIGPLTLGYYTDGPNTTPSTGTGPVGLWIDQFAAKLGVSDPEPGFVPGLGGTNYAIAGAETGTGTQSMQNQVTFFLGQHLTGISSSALYTFWGGANDIFDGASPTQAANNIFSQIKEVAADGGKYFLWLNLPPLGDTPGASVLGPTSVAQANAASAAFDSQWSTDLSTLHTEGIDVIGVDVSALFNQLIANPKAYGFTDVTDGCIFGPTPCTAASNPNQYLFWDDVHPTTQADMYVADAAYSDLVSTPEPATYALMLLGGFGLYAVRRSRKIS